MKKQKSIDSFQKNTVIFGYALLVSALLLEIIGAGLLINNILAYSTSDTRSRFITVITLMSLSAILPPLISYFTGELSTKKKLSTLTHHFNGVLFAGTAFILWLLLVTTSFQWIPLPNISFIPGRFIQFWPAVATIAVMITLGIRYAKSGLKDSVLTYKPFGITMLVAVFGWILVGLHSQVEVLNNTHTLQALVSIALPGMLSTLVMLGMFLFIYNLPSLRQYSSFKRASHAGAITVIGILVLSVIGQLVARFIPGLSAPVISLASCSLGLFIWLTYLRSIKAWSKR